MKFSCLWNLAHTNLEWPASFFVPSLPPYTGLVSDFTQETPEVANQWAPRPLEASSRYMTSTGSLWLWKVSWSIAHWFLKLLSRGDTCHLCSYFIARSKSKRFLRETAKSSTRICPERKKTWNVCGQPYNSTIATQKKGLVNHSTGKFDTTVLLEGFAQYTDQCCGELNTELGKLRLSKHLLKISFLNKFLCTPGHFQVFSEPSFHSILLFFLQCSLV